jgi:tRNA modification GTPase
VKNAVESAVDSLRTAQPLFVRATASGSGGIATLILDGLDVRLLLKPILQCAHDVALAESGALLFGRLLDGAGALVDEVLVAPLGREETQTGNEQIELSCHGGAGALAAVEETLLAAGYVRGRPTELHERGHLHGRLSLIALESRLGLAKAVSPRQAEFLLNSQAFQERLERLGFEVAFAMRTGAEGWRTRLHSAAESELALAAETMPLFKRHRVVLLGPVNAGKSSLANWFAGADRHLVSEHAGTTVDRLDTPLLFRGLDVLLIDTAGLRETQDGIEREAQSRAAAAADEADLRVLVLDGSRAPSDTEMEWVAAQARMEKGISMAVLTKADLPPNEAAQGIDFLLQSPALPVSVHSGAGLDAFSAALERALLPAHIPDAAAFTARHIARLKDVLARLDENAEPADTLAPLRALIGTRPNSAELQRVLEAAS